jgi:ubiquitin carboxyl-terminal hydrolase 10
MEADKQGGHQEDAEEFLGFFIETLHEELLQLVSRTESARASSTSQPQDIGDAVEIGRPSSPSDGWLEVGKKQKTNVVRATTVKESAVSRIFGGTLRSVLHVPGQKDSVTLESYQPLQLDIQSPTVKSIVDALKKLNEPEKFDYRSEVRNCNVEATKQVFIESFPPVLILHLKRFVFDPQARDVKTNKPVAYASELIIPSEIISPAQRTATPVKYRLFGVDYHHGASASGGHYTVAVARQDAKGWIHFDDETHSTIAEEDVVVSQDEAESGKVGLVGGREKCAYLLFYQRVR